MSYDRWSALMWEIEEDDDLVDLIQHRRDEVRSLILV